MDAELPLSGKEVVFAARSQFATAGQRPVFRCTRTGTAAAWTDSSPNTIELSLAPDAIDETEDSELTLADLQEGRDVLWRLDILDEDGWPRLRLQGDMQWLQEEGAWEDDPRSTPAIPSLNVSIIEGVASVTVALISDGASVNNASVVAAIEEDPDAARTALGLGSAALVPEEEFVGVMRMQEAEDNIGAVASDLATLSASLGDASTRDVGVANGVADLDGDGKIPVARMPLIAIVEFLGEAANQSAMLALSGQSGDWVKRTDTGTVWIIVGSNPSQLSSWSEISYPVAPVTSVAGLTGAIGSSALRTALGLGTADTPTFAGATINGIAESAGSSVNGFRLTHAGTLIGYMLNVFGTPRLAISGDLYFAQSGGDINNFDLRIGRNDANGLKVVAADGVSLRDFKLRNLTLSPSASLTPAANGDLMIEATSNTSITIKFKGSDGTVRSTVLTLS